MKCTPRVTPRGRKLTEKLVEPRWLALGERVTGSYLGQPFAGEVVDIAFPDYGGYGRVYMIRSDQPSNISKSAAMALPRQRLTATLTAAGQSLDHKGRPNGIVMVRPA